MMSHQQKLFPQSEQEQEQQEQEQDHEMCTNLKRPPLREGPNYLTRARAG